MKFHLTKIIATLLFCLGLASCSEDNSSDMSMDDFARNEMLSFWSDEIIIPAYEAYVESLEELDQELAHFINQAPKEKTLSGLRNSCLQAQISWQKVSMFEIGEAEKIGLRNFTNIFPTDTALINKNIAENNFNLALPSNFVAQGFPALDYLLYGIADNDQQILNLLKTEAYLSYLTSLISRLLELSDLVLMDWKNSFRNEFTSNDGSSGTASVDKMVNDFLFYYEKHFRAGKIGIPAGIFSGNTLSHSVEAPFAKEYSKTLFLEALTNIQNFFLGKSHDSSTEGPSLASYLKAMDQEPLADEISAQFNEAATKAAFLSDNFKEQVELDNSKMLEVYDELQKAVILMKVEMMQVLNIQVDYVDADGD